METQTTSRDLTQQAPHSPRERLAGFVIAKRAIDKCRANLVGQLGEYHFDCPLDKTLFSFKGITKAEFQAAVEASKDYEGVGVWLVAHGTTKTPAEIKEWSDQMESNNPMKDPERRSAFIEKCHRLGLNPEMNTTFDWLEADDRSTFWHKHA